MHCNKFVVFYAYYSLFKNACQDMQKFQQDFALRHWVPGVLHIA